MADLNKLALISPMLFDRLMDRLVRAEGGEKLHHEPTPDVNIESNIAAKAVDDMNSALKVRAPPSTQVKKYNKALNDFRNQLNKTPVQVDVSSEDREPSSNSVERKDTQNEVNTQTEPFEYEDSIKTQLTLGQQAKAKQILEYIYKNGDRVKTNENGEIYVDEDLIEDGKIDALIVGGIRNRGKSVATPGQVKLFKVLLDSGMPKSLLGNEDLKSKLNSKWDES